jgi:sugar lactone lactonase YvrE
MANLSSSNGRPEISTVTPSSAIPGGEFQIRGAGLSGESGEAEVMIGDQRASIIIGSDSYVVAGVPESAAVGELTVGSGDNVSAPWLCDIGLQIADEVHPVANPAVDRLGHVFATFSGSRGQKTDVAVFRVDLNHNIEPFVTDLMNATGLAFDSGGQLYVSSRHDGIIYEASESGRLSVYVEGMGVATGMAFDSEDNLYVGDRSGTIFKISRDRQIYVFATVEPSISAFHLAIGPDDHLYVTGPTTSSFDSVNRVTPNGDVEPFYRGLGRPQGLAFDIAGNLYVAASLRGRKGIVRIDRKANAELFVSGPNIVGLAFTPSKSMIVATSTSLYRVDVDIQGRPLP